MIMSKYFFVDYGSTEKKTMVILSFPHRSLFHSDFRSFFRSRTYFRSISHLCKNSITENGTRTERGTVGIGSGAGTQDLQ